MYAALLHLHNVARWLVLVLAVVAIVMALRSLVTGAPRTRGSRLSGTLFVISMDVQLLLGVVLYFVSPLVRAGLADFGGAMADATLRFFVVEHALLMVLAVAAAHVGAVTVRRATTDRAKAARAAIWFTLSLVLTLVAVPWWRPLFPGL